MPCVIGSFDTLRISSVHLNPYISSHTSDHQGAPNTKTHCPPNIQHGKAGRPKCFNSPSSGRRTRHTMTLVIQEKTSFGFHLMPAYRHLLRIYTQDPVPFCPAPMSVQNQNLQGHWHEILRPQTSQPALLQVTPAPSLHLATWGSLTFPLPLSLFHPPSPNTAQLYPSEAASDVST